jgi:mannose-1-phosphate guanylyltransferase
MNLSHDPAGSAWAVVLAAGEGRRLRPLTRALYGRDLPKQFAEIEPGRTMLQATLDRIAPIFPARRTIVVVDRTQEDDARPQLERFPGVDLALQPRNLDTAPGVLFPLARVLAREPGARVAIFPSDHYVPRPAPLLAATRQALRDAARSKERVTLLGVVPQEAEGEYGWIVPGHALEGGPSALRAVRQFVEKPPPAVAASLLRARRALWNTFVSVGRAAAFFSLADLCVPALSALFRAYAGAVDGPAERAVLEAIYERTAPSNFSRDVLERAPNLAVLPVEGSGWSDWGSPDRVFRSLEERGLLAPLQSRLRAPLVPA